MASRTVQKVTPQPAQGAGAIRERVDRLRQAALAAARSAAGELATVPVQRRPSAENLVHYLALRRRDLRRVQVALSGLGLSSLGRCEGHALSALDRLQRALVLLSDEPAAAPGGALGQVEGRRRLAGARRRLLGAPRPERRTAIMVTIPETVAEDAALARTLIDAGMDVTRINAAHGDPALWQRMAARVRAAATAARRPCRIAIDLPGPKVRTGALATLPGVLRCKPVRDRFGRVTAPGSVRLVAAGALPPVDALPLPSEFHAALRPGDRLQLVDARGKRRELRVARLPDGALHALADAGAYLIAGAAMRLRRQGRTLARARIAALPPHVEPLRLHRGDQLLLSTDAMPGAPARCDRRGRQVAPARIPCTLPAALAGVRPGQRVCFDDGRVIAIARRRQRTGILLEVVQARAQGFRLKPDQGINLPDTELDLPALGDADRTALVFAVRHADLVGQSFIRSPEDVAELAAALAAAGGRKLGIVAKIETPQAFERLPRILLALLRLPAAGVMIARGDLAVEIGFPRLAEVQEEILWLCEAAHLPVIWGTQVLETMVKTGVPTRAEVTDAAMGARAECVMLNRGDHLPEAITFLSDVLARMQGHQDKKRVRLRRLAVARMDGRTGGR